MVYTRLPITFYAISLTEAYCKINHLPSSGFYIKLVTFYLLCTKT